MDYIAKFFKRELSLIENEDLREYVKSVLKKMPDSWWEQPASIRHHPGFARGLYGLPKHIKATVLWAEEWSDAQNATTEERDTAIAALLLHHCTLEKEDSASQFFAQIADPIRTVQGRWAPKAKSDTEWKETRVQEIVHAADFCASRSWLNISWL